MYKINQLPLTVEDISIEKELQKTAATRSIIIERVVDSGLSGGWPEYKFSSESKSALYDFMADLGFDAEDVDEFIEIG